MCAIASGALHTATTTTFYVVQVGSVVYVVVYYLHDNLYNINNNLCCTGCSCCRPHNKHDNQNNGDNKLSQLQRLSPDIILHTMQLRFEDFRVGTTDFFREENRRHECDNV